MVSELDGIFLWDEIQLPSETGRRTDFTGPVTPLERPVELVRGGIAFGDWKFMAEEGRHISSKADCRLRRDVAPTVGKFRRGQRV